MSVFELFKVKLNWCCHLYMKKNCLKLHLLPCLCPFTLRVTFNFSINVLKSESCFWMSTRSNCPTGQNTIDWFMWNVVESREKRLMMWSFAAIFDFLRRLSGLSGYFKASTAQQTWECNSAVSGSSAIFKTHFISLAPPLFFLLSFYLSGLTQERVEVKLSGVSNNYFTEGEGRERDCPWAGGKEEMCSYLG